MHQFAVIAESARIRVSDPVDLEDDRRVRAEAAVGGAEWQRLIELIVAIVPVFVVPPSLPLVMQKPKTTSARAMLSNGRFCRGVRNTSSSATLSRTPIPTSVTAR